MNHRSALKGIPTIQVSGRTLYGAGLWGAVGAVQATGIALAATLALLLALMAWRQVFALGPFEWILRRITRHGLSPR
jgi:uncharacterized membrane protein YeiB